MATKALVPDLVHVLVRKNPRTGYKQRVTYVGSLRNKPVGWTVDTSVAPTRAMATESGLA